MIKVAHLLSSLQMGGAEILTLDLCKNANREFRISVLYNTEGSLLEKFKATDAILKRLNKSTLYLRYMLELRKFVLKERIDIVHIHSVVNPVPVLVALLFTNVRFVLSVHGYDLSKRKYLNWVHRKCEKFLYVSDTVRNAFLENLKTDSLEKDYIIYNGIDPQKFESFPSLGLKKDRQNILMGMVGNFKSERDHLTVCKALKYISDQGHTFRFLFVGAVQIQKFYDECYQYCESNQLLDKVQFLGPRDDIPEILSELDLFVFSSKYDTFGIAVVEAMMSGIPVIVNDLEVFKEITNNGKYASLYKSGDPLDLSCQIIEMIGNKNMRKNLGEKAKKFAFSEYSISNHLKNLNLIYQSVLKN